MRGEPMRGAPICGVPICGVPTRSRTSGVTRVLSYADRGTASFEDEVVGSWSIDVFRMP